MPQSNLYQALAGSPAPDFRGMSAENIQAMNQQRQAQMGQMLQLIQAIEGRNLEQERLQLEQLKFAVSTSLDQQKLEMQQEVTESKTRYYDTKSAADQQRLEESKLRFGMMQSMSDVEVDTNVGRMSMLQAMTARETGLNVTIDGDTPKHVEILELRDEETGELYHTFVAIDPVLGELHGDPIRIGLAEDDLKGNYFHNPTTDSTRWFPDGQDPDVGYTHKVPTRSHEEVTHREVTEESRARHIGTLQAKAKDPEFINRAIENHLDQMTRLDLRHPPGPEDSQETHRRYQHAVKARREAIRTALQNLYGGPEQVEVRCIGGNCGYYLIDEEGYGLFIREVD